MSKDRFEEYFRSNDLFKLRIKEWVDGGAPLSFNPGIFNIDEKGNHFGDLPSTIFISENSNEKNKELSDRFGRIFISRNEMKVFGKILFFDSKYIIGSNLKQKNTLKSWEGLSNVKLPFSDLILIDNYFIRSISKSSGRSSIYNLIQILKGLLPRTCKQGSIRLSIISDDNYDNNYNIKYTENEKNEYRKRTSDDWYQMLLEALKVNFSELCFSVYIAIIPWKKKLNHDRILLTNYIWLDSGHGFDCFDVNGNTKVKTTLKFIPIFSSSEAPNSASSFDCWLTLKDQVKNMIENNIYEKGKIKSNSLLA
jgi:hypothetical protein